MSAVNLEGVRMPTHTTLCWALHFHSLLLYIAMFILPFLLFQLRLALPVWEVGSALRSGPGAFSFKKRITYFARDLLVFLTPSRFTALVGRPYLFRVDQSSLFELRYDLLRSRKVKTNICQSQWKY